MKKQIIEPGTPLMVSRGLYWHHGIYAGLDRRGTHRVIGYDGDAKHKTGASVRLVTWAEFADGGKVMINNAVLQSAAFSRQDALQKAVSRLNEKGFDLLKNNCEHFVHWCFTGRHFSPQVKALAGVTSVVGIFAVVGLAGYALTRA